MNADRSGHDQAFSGTDLTQVLPGVSKGVKQQGKKQAFKNQPGLCWLQVPFKIKHQKNAISDSKPFGLLTEYVQIFPSMVFRKTACSSLVVLIKC